MVIDVITKLIHFVFIAFSVTGRNFKRKIFAWVFKKNS